MTTLGGNGVRWEGDMKRWSGGAVMRLTHGEGKMVPMPRGARSLIIKGGPGIGNVDWRDGGVSLGGPSISRRPGRGLSLRPGIAGLRPSPFFLVV